MIFFWNRILVIGLSYDRKFGLMYLPRWFLSYVEDFTGDLTNIDPHLYCPVKETFCLFFPKRLIFFFLLSKSFPPVSGQNFPYVMYFWNFLFYATVLPYIANNFSSSVPFTSVKSFFTSSWPASISFFVFSCPASRIFSGHNFLLLQNSLKV